PQQGQVGRFPIDHIIPRSQGGLTDLANLALACPHCNARKWAHTTGPESAAGAPVALFNPRTAIWEQHFAWDRDRPCQLNGKTPCGQATVSRLQMNHPDVVTVRSLLAELGLFST